MYLRWLSIFCSIFFVLAWAVVSYFFIPFINVYHIRLRYVYFDRPLRSLSCSNALLECIIEFFLSFFYYYSVFCASSYFPFGCRYEIRVLIICLFIYNILIHAQYPQIGIMLCSYTVTLWLSLTLCIHWNGIDCISKYTQDECFVSLFVFLFSLVFGGVPVSVHRSFVFFSLFFLMYMPADLRICIYDLLCVFYFRNKIKTKKEGLLHPSLFMISISVLMSARLFFVGVCCCCSLSLK